MKKGKEESLKRFHPWIFSGAVANVDEGVEEGELVRVITASGDFIAVGMFQIGSIAVRVLSFRDVEIDAEFWASRLASAWEMRKAIGENRGEGFFCKSELDAMPSVMETEHERVVRFAHLLKIMMDGKRQEGAVLRR